MTHLPIVISFTDFSNFKRCRKLFDLSYLRQLSPKGDASPAMQSGTDIHKLLELEARGLPWTGSAPVEHAEVTRAYLNRHPLPNGIISAEEPIYLRVLGETDAQPAVYIRVTLDLIYTRGKKTIVGRDYKTFMTAPSFDFDLDFQGRIYSTVLWRTYPSNDIEFEWVPIRQALGRDLKGKGFVAWTEEERYPQIPPIVMSDIEYETTWRELQETTHDLIRAVLENRLYRSDLKAGPHSCDNCHYKGACKAEYSHGELTPMDAALFTDKTNPGARATLQGMLADPRVVFHAEHADDPTAVGAIVDAVNNVYGATGIQLLQGATHAHR
jgi:hypothetical protein